MATFDPASLDMVNLDVKAPGGFFPDDGDHYMYASSLKAGTSTKGNPTVEVELIIIDPGDTQRVLKFNYFTLTTKAIWRFKEFALAASPDLKPGLDATDTESLMSYFFGLPFRATTRVYESTYQGKKSDKCDIDGYTALTPEDEETLREAYGDALVPEQEESEGTGVSGSTEDDPDAPPF